METKIELIKHSFEKDTDLDNELSVRLSRSFDLDHLSPEESYENISFMRKKAHSSQCFPTSKDTRSNTQTKCKNQRLSEEERFIEKGGYVVASKSILDQVWAGLNSGEFEYTDNNHFDRIRFKKKDNTEKFKRVLISDTTKISKDIGTASIKNVQNKVSLSRSKSEETLQAEEDESMRKGLRLSNGSNCVLIKDSTTGQPLYRICSFGSHTSVEKGKTELDSEIKARTAGSMRPEDSFITKPPRVPSIRNFVSSPTPLWTSKNFRNSMPALNLGVIISDHNYIQESFENRTRISSGQSVDEEERKSINSLSSALDKIRWHYKSKVLKDSDITRQKFS